MLLCRRLLGCILSLFVLPLAGCGGKSAPAGDRSNVLFIAVDDLNDWVNCLGGRRGVQTPNLDRLASRGLLFTNAHCSAPSCSPSRVSLLTGFRPSTSGVYNNGQNWRKSRQLRTAVTLPQHFKAHGYRAIGAGKIFHAGSWMLNSGWDGFNDAASWDAYFPSIRRAMPDEVHPSNWPLNVISSEQAKKGFINLFQWQTVDQFQYQIESWKYFDWAPVDVPDEAMADWKVADWAAAELQKKQEKPFFMAVGIYRPHVPWYAPPQYFDRYPLDQIELPHVQENDLGDTSPVGQAFAERKWHRWIMETGQWKKALQGYLASVTFADAMIGKLVAALDRSLYAENTVIVLWSDHGMHLGEKEHWEKFTLWEESARVPLMIVAPGLTRSGERCDRPVSLLDLYPTLLEICGLPARKELEGTSLVPLLRNPEAPWDIPAVTTWGPNNHAVRSERWRYIRYHDGSEELYDHRTDPDEFNNLAPRKEFQPVKADLARWLPARNADLDPPVQSNAEIAREMEESLTP